MLEGGLWEHNAFLTLTYEDGHLPILSNGLPSLDPIHLKNWLKRFRKEIEPLRVRFFAVGEYGDESERPHYHAIIFGFPTCDRGRTLRKPGSTRPEWADCCDYCRSVGRTWQKGDVDCGSLTTESAQYIAGYTTKKLSKGDLRLRGRYPEFARQSNREGGIGIGALDAVAAELERFNLAALQGDVPSSLRHGKRIMPLGRYLRRKLRKAVGMDESAPQVTLDEAKERLRPVQEAAFEASQSLKKAVMEAGDQGARNLETRGKIFKGRRSI